MIPTTAQPRVKTAVFAVVLAAKRLIGYGVSASTSHGVGPQSIARRLWNNVRAILVLVLASTLPGNGLCAEPSATIPVPAASGGESDAESALKSCHGVACGDVHSPDRTIRAALDLSDGVPTYSVWRLGRRIVSASALQLELKEPFEGGFTLDDCLRESRNSDWQPIYGERRRIPDRYEALTVQVTEKGSRHRQLQIELRAYNEGIAFRYRIPAQTQADGWHITQERSEFRFEKGCKAYPIFSTEQTFSATPVNLDSLRAGAHTPLSIQLSDGFASVLEAFAENYPRMRLDKTPDGALVTQLRGPVAAKAPFASPWRVVLLGANEGRLIENEHLVLTLNPPCTMADTSWIIPGKTISNEGTAPLETTALKKVVDFAATNGFRYLQLDWGWYGTETTWSDEDRNTFRKTVPELAKNEDWPPNTVANPFQVAKGLVPYRPDWKQVTNVDLEMSELIRYAKDRNVGVCLYVEAGTTLPAHDMEKLFSTYQRWGVAGLKPGFVRYGRQENTEWIRRMVRTAADHHLWLCIHDEHVPDGMERTYPNLMISEGGGGQEGGHPVCQDVMLPFTRCLAGPFDYTPGIYTKGRSHAHMLAFYVVYYGPASTMRGGYAAWNGATGPEKGGAELEFLRRAATTWDETIVLDAHIGQRIVVARRSGDTWFLGGMTGDEPQTVDVSLEFLTVGRKYLAQVWSDEPSAATATAEWIPTKAESKTVSANDRLRLEMAKAGGCVAIFTPQ